jgi:hypothetical protein
MMMRRHARAGGWTDALLCWCHAPVAQHTQTHTYTDTHIRTDTLSHTPSLTHTHILSLSLMPPPPPSFRADLPTDPWSDPGLLTRAPDTTERMDGVWVCVCVCAGQQASKGASERTSLAPEVRCSRPSASWLWRRPSPALAIGPTVQTLALGRRSRHACEPPSRPARSGDGQDGRALFRIWMKHPRVGRPTGHGDLQTTPLPFECSIGRSLISSLPCNEPVANVRGSVCTLYVCMDCVCEYANRLGRRSCYAVYM